MNVGHLCLNETFGEAGLILQWFYSQFENLVSLHINEQLKRSCHESEMYNKHLQPQVLPQDEINFVWTLQKGLLFCNVMMAIFNIR